MRCVHVSSFTACVACVTRACVACVTRAGKVKVKTGYLYSGTVSLTATGGCRLFCSALPVRSAIAATHLSSPEVGNGLSWLKPQCTCNAMVTSQAQHSANEGVLRSNSACSMLMSDDLRLPRRGIEPRPSGFRSRHRLSLGHRPSRGVRNVCVRELFTHARTSCDENNGWGVEFKNECYPRFREGGIHWCIIV